MRTAMLLLFALLGAPRWVTAADQHGIVISFLPRADDPLFVTCREIMNEAYRRIGMKMIVQPMPGERSLIAANSGQTDGDLCRKKEALSGYPNLVMVATPLMRVEIVAFSLRKLDIERWKDLARYRFSYQRGVKVVEQNTEGMRADIVNNFESGYRMLEAGRIDAYIGSKISGSYMLGQLGQQHFFVSPPLETFTMHHYLNVKNAALIGKLTEALAQMQKEGVIARIERSATGQ